MYDDVGWGSTCRYLSHFETNISYIACIIQTKPLYLHCLHLCLINVGLAESPCGLKGAYFYIGMVANYSKQT